MAGLTSLTPEIEDALVERVSNGVPIGRALGAAGIQSQTYKEWERIAKGAETWENGLGVAEETRARIHALYGRIARARDQYAARLVENIHATGFIVGKSGLPEWRAHSWLLEHHPDYKAEFAQHKELTVTGQSTVRIEAAAVRQLDTGQLKQLLAGDDLDLLPPGAAATVDGELIRESVEDGPGAELAGSGE